MADREAWEKRVSEWRTGGLSSRVYCEGKDFTPGGLRYWANRLDREAGRSPTVRLAKVKRVRARSREVSHRPGLQALVVEVGGARVEVRPGFDRSALAEVLEILMTAARGA
jgi:hypothetical protein